MSSVVLDASAMLALLNDEPGAARVRVAIRTGALMSAVNLSEVVTKLSDDGVDPTTCHQILDPFALDVVDFDEDLAYRTGALRPVTRRLGLSLGDRACLALAERAGLTALTTDRNWASLTLGISIQLIR